MEKGIPSRDGQENKPTRSIKFNWLFTWSLRTAKNRRINVSKAVLGE